MAFFTIYNTILAVKKFGVTKYGSLTYDEFKKLI
jgi:hypothetical protein